MFVDVLGEEVRVRVFPHVLVHELLERLLHRVREQRVAVELVPHNLNHVIMLPCGHIQRDVLRTVVCGVYIWRVKTCIITGAHRCTHGNAGVYAGV